MRHPNNLTLQALDQAGLKTLVNWARTEGWNPGPHDYEAFWATDPEGFYGFYAGGQLIAGGAVVSYGGAYGFMGLFIVHPDYRGQGIGNKLWYLRRDLLIKRLKAGASIGMDGVVAMQPFYNKGGFEIAFKDERYECIGRATPVSGNISNITAADFNEILFFDTQCFGFERATFLEHWLKLPNVRTFQHRTEGMLNGFAVMRQATTGFKIGPLFADNDEAAEDLYKACLNSAIDQPIYLDIPMTNTGAVHLVKKYQAKYVFECARMYYGDPPSVDMNKVYGITTFELG